MSARRPKRRILFSGSAWVHFVCVAPMYRRLARDPRVELFLTGGYKRAQGEETFWSLEGFYDPFEVDPARLIPAQEAARQDFDVLLCAQLNPAMPRCAGKSVQVFHGVSFKNFVAREKYLVYDYLCLAGRYHAEAYARLGLVRRKGQCLVTGMPKVDSLVGGGLHREATLRRAGVDPALPTVLYAPTGSKYNSMETMGLDVIRAIGEAGRWNLLVKLHDHPKNTGVDWAREVKSLESDRVRGVGDPDVVPYLHAADLLLTDASSVAMEYTLLDRPLVFLDVPELFQDVRERGGVLDLETHGRKTGVVVQRPDQVVEAIQDGLAHPDREGELRRAAARHVFHDPGAATDRVTGVVLYAAGLISSLPEGVEALQPAQRGR